MGFPDQADSEPATKRAKLDIGAKSTESLDPTKISDVADEQLRVFLTWCVSGAHPISFNPKLFLGKSGTSSRYGMIAREDIEKDEVLFTIPKERVLTWENLENANEIRDTMEKMALKSRWSPTVFAIVFESLSLASNWKAYLDLFFVNNHFDLPLLWDKQSQEALLKGLDLQDRIEKDRQKIKEDFVEHVFPALRKFAGVEESAFESLLETAYKVSAFIMSYSFTRPEPELQPDVDSDSDEDGESAEMEEEATKVGHALVEVPVMVPIADFLNASVSKNNAKPHWKDDEEMLTMIATKLIKKGEEVYNTYGEVSNQEMLYLYGYAEDDTNNPYEEVFIKTDYLKDILLEDLRKETPSFVAKTEYFENRWEYLEKEREAVGAECPIALGSQGILSDNDLHVCLRVCRMSDDEFVEYSEEGNTDEVDEFEPETYSLAQLSQLPPEVKQVLYSVVNRRVGDFPNSLEQEEANLKRLQSEELLDKRDLWVTLVRRVQLSLLHKYLTALR